MSMYFTSDLHLGHNNILPTRTQFSTIEEHDRYLIQQWNKKVHKDDEVYILGDLSFRSLHHISHYLQYMKGKKHLIVGNHDADWMRHVEDLSEYFVSVDHLKTIKFAKKKVTLCHYPMLEFPGSRYDDEGGSYLVHGHIHALKNEEVYGYIKEHQPNALNASVDINGFAPVSFEELLLNNAVWYEREQLDLI